MNLAKAFAASVEKRPEKIALYWGDSEFTAPCCLHSQAPWRRNWPASSSSKPGDRIGKAAAVIGVPHTRKGELPVAFVPAEEDQTLDAAALLQFVRGQLADYQVPKKVVFMPASPRNATGKILKTALRQRSEF